MAEPNLKLAFNLPPERAMEYFRSRGLRTSANWQEAAAAVKAGAFSVAGVARADVLDDIRQSLDKALAGGQTYADWLGGVKPMLAQRGWLGKFPHDPETGEILRGKALTPWRLETIFRTNLQQSYMSGRYKAQLENADRRGNWQYVAILDSHTRPRHRALNGRVFRYDDAAWGAIYPPNGYNCRCRVRALTDEEMQAEGVSLSTGDGNMETITRELRPRGGQPNKVPVTGWRDPATGELFAPDTGFDFSPARAAWGRDIALARNTQAIASREIRTQVWRALNNSPSRAAAFYNRAKQIVATRGQSPRPGVTTGAATVIGFLDEDAADFARKMDTEAEPTRVLAITDKAILDADSNQHLADGVALSLDQYAALPGIIARPDQVFWDTQHANLAFIRYLVDGSAIYVPVTPAQYEKKIGRIDALVTAYRLLPGDEGVGRLKNRRRFVPMPKPLKGP